MDEINSNVKLDWMYKGINGLVNREDYLLGRSVDKTLDQLNNEEKEKKLGIVPPKNHVEHECIPPSIRDYNKIVEAEQVDLSAKLQEDPLMAIKKREEEARRKFLQNPVQLKKLQEALKAQEHKKKKKYKLADSTDSDSDDDLDKKLVEKLQYLKSDPSAACALKKEKKKAKKHALDTILMHKFNELKDRLSQEDLNDILEGNVSDSSEEEKRKKRKQIKSKKLRANSDSEDSKNTRIRKRKKYHSSSSDSEGDNKKTKEEKSKKKSSSKNSKTKKKVNREAETTSSESSEEDNKEKGKLKSKIKDSDRSKTIRSKRYSSSDESHIVKSKKDQRKYDKRSDSSTSEDESKYKRKYSKREIKSSTNDRKRNKYRERSESDSSSCEDNRNRRHRNSSNMTKKRNSRSISRDKRYKRSSSRESSSEKIKGERKERSMDRGKREKLRFDRSNSEDRKHHNQSSTKDRKQSIRSNEKRTLEKGTHREEDPNNLNKAKSSQNKESELDRMIIDKLRQLRDSKHNSSSDEESRVYTQYDSDNDEVVKKKKHFGLVRADGSKIELKRNTTTSNIEKQGGPKEKEVTKKPEKKNVKKLTEEEKEKIRKQMMKDAVKREKERSENLRQYREEDKKEEMAMSYNRDFIHKELVKSTKDTSIEGRIKSKLNSIQRSSVHMSSNFSKKS